MPRIIRYKYKWWYLLIPLFFFVIPWAIMCFSNFKKAGQGMFALFIAILIGFFSLHIVLFITNFLSITDTYYGSIVILAFLHITGIPWTFHLIKEYETDRDDFENDKLRRK